MHNPCSRLWSEIASVNAARAGSGCPHPPCPRPRPGQENLPARWRKLKSRFTRAVGVEARRSDRVGDLPTLRQWPRSESKIRKGERGLWQRRYREHMIRDAEDWLRHAGYCWINPVKHGLVGAVRDWPLSSFHRDAQRGLVTED